MAKFDPPDSHWADDFDARLASTFAWLRDEVTRLQGEVTALSRRDAERDEVLAQAVRDMKFYVEGR